MKQRTFREVPTDTPPSYPTPAMKELFEAVLQLESKEEAANFFRDLLTIAEIEEFTNRWQMVKQLFEGKPYTAIAADLKVSTATVTRCAHWLHHGMGGYQLIANRMFAKKQAQATKKPFRLRGKRTWG